MGKGNERPELTAPPEIFYNEDEAVKYTNNSRMIAIQKALTERAMELLCLPQDNKSKMLLDLGCGSCLSGQWLSNEGHLWIGTDISEAMLEVAVEREVEGDVMLHDLGHGLPFRSGMFDGAVSISAVQWLCNADKKEHDPKRRMKRFFETLYRVMTRGARAALQIYPSNLTQAEMLTTAAMRVGFSGGMVVDYPHSARAKKYYLVLMVGGSQGGAGPSRGLEGEPGRVEQTGRHKNRNKPKAMPGGKNRDWVLNKKDQMRKKGYKTIPVDTKYTGRKRKTKF